MCVCPEHQRWLVIEGGQLMAIATVLRSSTTKAITASFDEQEVTQMPNYSQNIITYQRVQAQQVAIIMCVQFKL